MATPPLAADLKTARKWVRAYVALGVGPEVDTERRLKRLDRLALAMSHWYSDDAQEVGCDCEACEWWAASIRAHRRARN